MEGLVGQGEHVERGVEVAHGMVGVDRLDGVAADEVHDLEHLAQLQQILERRPVARPAVALQVDVVGRRAHRAERQVVATDGQRVVRVPGVEPERLRGGGDPLDDHAGVEADPRCRVGVDVRAGGLQQAAGLRVEEIDPGVAEDAE